MKRIMNNKLLSYLSKILLPKGTELIITDLEKVIYSTDEKYKNLTIDDSLILHFVRNDDKEFYIFNSKSLKYNQDNQYILPLINNSDSICGTIIFICKNINESSKRFFKSIKFNVDFYIKKYTVEEIKRKESNPIYNNYYIIEISKILEDTIDRIYCDKNYRHIEELLAFKIDMLKSDLESHNRKLFDEIYSLLQEQKKFFLFILRISLKKKLICAFREHIKKVSFQAKR